MDQFKAEPEACAYTGVWDRKTKLVGLHAGLCLFYYVCVCNQFPKATAAQQASECRNLLCDDFQLTHGFP